MPTVTVREMSILCHVTTRTVKAQAQAGTLTRVAPGQYHAFECAHFEFRRVRLPGKAYRLDDDAVDLLTKEFRGTLRKAGWTPAEVTSESRKYRRLLAELNGRRGWNLVSLAPIIR